MKKYIELALEYNKEQKIEDRIEETASILKDKLEAKIAMQKAYITEQKSAVRTAEKNLLTAKATITESIDTYLANVLNAMDELDAARETLEAKIATLESLKQISELF